MRAENGPALEVRVQELFGMDKHPSVAGGKVPLLLVLLSPAHRPIQTTQDLPASARELEGRGEGPEGPLSAALLA